MTSTFRVIFLASSVSQCAGRGASRQVDLGPTFMILSLRVLMLLRHEYRRHLEYTCCAVRNRGRLQTLTDYLSGLRLVAIWRRRAVATG